MHKGNFWCFCSSKSQQTEDTDALQEWEEGEGILFLQVLTKKKRKTESQKLKETDEEWEQQ